ncbi:hypothetical protein ZTR_11397 [Talaromyces verruculosus]|nr:hypothetical protein ZTR_11397 [Talaromyces verruculosus]
MSDAEELDTTAWNHNITLITSSFVDVLRHPREHVRQSIWSSEVMDLYWTGGILPQGRATTYSISELAKASRDSMCMDPGNIAVSLMDSNSVVNLRSPTYNTVLDPSRIYILVGGLGGIGVSITKWMLSRGARRFVFVGRSDPAHGKNEAFVDSVRSTGATVNVEQGDVTCFEDMKRVISAMDEPIGGVVHAAMGLSEAVFSKMSAKAWHTSIGPKLKGCWNLHNSLLETGNNSLDFFLVISSAFGSVGSIAQSNYCAANSALDTFARYRRSLGLPAVSVGLGIITDVGYLSENPEVEEKALRSGISSLNEKEMLLVIDQALSADYSNSQFDTFSTCHFVTGLEYLSNPSLRRHGHQGLPYFAGDQRFSRLITAQNRKNEPLKEERKGILAELYQLHQRGASLDDPIFQHIKQGLGQILELDTDKIDLTRSLPNYGIDSMIGTEIRMWLFRSLQVDVSLFQILSKTMTIQMLTSTVVELISERLG